MTVSFAEARKTARVSRSNNKEATSVEIITPEMAAEWVTQDVNGINRILNPKKVTQYARDMSENRWEFNNDALCFDVEGKLLNGQHRLHACIMSDKPFKTVVIRNMRRRAQNIMDQHAVRTIAGALQIAGHMRSARLGGAIRSLINIKHAAQAFNAYRPTATEQIEVLKKHPGLEQSVAMVDKTSRGVSPALLAAIHYVAKHLLDEPEKADAFLMVFRTGVPSYRGCAAHALRESALRLADRKARKSEATVFFSLIRAWNLFREDQPIARWNTPKADVVPMKGLKTDLI